jgi:hypothetical protein
VTASAWAIPPLALLAGWFIWTRLPAGAHEADDLLERLFAAVLCAVFGTGLSALILAEVGMLRPLTLAGVLSVLALVFWRLPKAAGAPATASSSHIVAFLATATLAAATVWPASEDLLGGRDPGVYANEASWLAREGSLRVRVRSLTEVEERARPGFHSRYVFIPGFHIRNAETGELIPQFFHLFPVYMALGFWLGGIQGAFFVAPFLGALAELSFFLYVRRVIGTGSALVATGLLAINLAQMWVVRNPYSEGATQLGVFTVLLCLARGHESAGIRWNVLGALAVGTCLLLRIDSALLMTALIPAVIVLRASLRSHDPWASRLFIPATTALGAWALVHGWVFSRPYTRGLMAHVGPIWLTNVVLLAVLAAGGAARERTRRLLGYLHAHGRIVWIAVAGVMCVAFVFGMWVRPHLEPFDLLRDRPGRTYDEETMIRLAWYVSTQGMVTAFVGTAVILRNWLVRRHDEWVPFLFVFIGFSVAYFYSQRVFPDHPWAMRRFLPVIVPGIYVAIGAALVWLWRLRPPWWFLGRTAAVCLLASLAFHQAAMARPFLAHREYRGVVAQLREFASHVPPSSLLLFTSRGTEQRVTLPLTMVWEREVLPVIRDRDDPDGEARRHLFETQVASWLTSGRDVLYLAAQDGNAVYLSSTIEWIPVTTLRLQGPTMGMNYTHPPLKPAAYLEPFHLFRARRADQRQLPPCAPASLRLGRGLANSAQGLYAPQDSGRYRWTMPESRVLMPPCDRSGPSRPHRMRVQAACGPSVRQCRVEVVVDGLPAGVLELRPRFADYELPVPTGGLAQLTGPIDVRFRGSRDEDASNVLGDRSFRLAAIEVLPSPDAPPGSMRHLFRAAEIPANLNLISDRAEIEWGVRLQGFHRSEARLRWTTRRALLLVPLGRRTPKALRINFVRTSRDGSSVRVSANECGVFDGSLPRRNWEATFSLAGCRITGDELRIVIESEVARPPNDPRDLGVALRYLMLDPM